MRIYCKWDGNVLAIMCMSQRIGFVEQVVGSEPVLILTGGDCSLTFSEIEHVMDNWHNLPKN